MNVIDLLEYLQELIETGAKVPLSGKVMIDKNDAVNTIDEIINYLPDEFKKAQWVVGEKERILTEANKQYEAVKKETMDMMKKQVENHDIIKEAKIRSQEIIAQAQRDAKTMRLGARDYADEILCQFDKEMEEKVQDMIVSMKQVMETFMQDVVSNINETSNTVRENIKELRDMK